MSATAHPQMDGQTERANRSVLQMLRHYVNNTGSDWAQHLSMVEFAMNSATSCWMEKAPFEVRGPLVNPLSTSSQTDLKSETSPIYLT